MIGESDKAKSIRSTSPFICKMPAESSCFDLHPSQGELARLKLIAETETARPLAIQSTQLMIYTELLGELLRLGSAEYAKMDENY